MKKYKINHIVILVSAIWITLVPFKLHAQNLLTLQNAIDTALLNNYDIQIAKNNVAIATKNNTIAMAGGLPIVAANASNNLSLSTLNQQNMDGSATMLKNKGENNLNAGINSSIVLFNGFKVIATKEKLNRLQNISEIDLNKQIQSLIADITITYHDIVRQENYLNIIKSTLDISKKKLEIIQVKKDIGLADGAEFLQAQSDLNSAEQLFELQKLTINQSKADLLLLINSKSNLSFSVPETIEVDSLLNFETISSFLTQNPDLQSADQQVFIREQIVKEISAQRYPAIRLNGGYDYYRTNSNKGTSKMMQNFGPSATIGIQVPIFNGNIYKTQKEIAKIQVENAKLEKENIDYTLNMRALKLFRSYSTMLAQINQQRLNFGINQQLVDIIMQQFKLGQATILDLKAAINSYENAAYMLVNLQYSAKVAETGLKQMTFSLRPE